jgi:hypothetical protein
MLSMRRVFSCLSSLHQTDRRECIENNGIVVASKEHCARAFQALVDHLQGKPVKRGRALGARALADLDMCPFFVRWEVPRYGRNEVNAMCAEHAYRQMDPEEAQRSAMAAAEQAHALLRGKAANANLLVKGGGGAGGSRGGGRGSRRGQGGGENDTDGSNSLNSADEAIKKEQKARVLRWPLNPTPWIDDDGNTVDTGQSLDNADEKAEIKARGHDLLMASTLSSGGLITAATSSSSAIAAGNGHHLSGNNNNNNNNNNSHGGGGPPQDGEVYERVRMDPVYERLVLGLQRKHQENLLWSRYFPATAVSWRSSSRTRCHL